MNENEPWKQEESHTLNIRREFVTLWYFHYNELTWTSSAITELDLDCKAWRQNSIITSLGFKYKNNANAKYNHVVWTGLMFLTGFLIYT